MAGDIDDVFLNEDEFGEPATFLPLGDESRAISLVVVVAASRIDIEQEQMEEQAPRHITVCCKKAALADVNFDQENLGHALYLESEPSNVWDFVRVSDDANGMLDIEFQRRNLKTLRPGKLSSGR